MSTFDLSAVGNVSASAYDIRQQRIADLRKMEAAIQAGDISAAQQALVNFQGVTSSAPSLNSVSTGPQSSFQSTLQSVQLSTAGVSSTTAANASDPSFTKSLVTLGTDLKTLVKNLLSGDASAAQNAAAAIPGDVSDGLTSLQAMLGGALHSHHHHHHGVQSASTGTNPANTLEANTTPSTVTPSNNSSTNGVNTNQSL
jgi:hypothetical protein